MKSAKNILFIVVIALVVLAQGYYLMTYYRQDMAQIADNNDQIEEAEIRINQLEERLKRFEESKKELEQAKTEKVAMENKIPVQNSQTKIMNEFSDYMKNAECASFSFKNEGTEAVTTDIGEIFKTKYTLEFVSTYKNAQEYISHIKNMYQVCAINKYEFDTAVQSEQKTMTLYKDFFGKDFDSIGKAKLEFDAYYRADGQLVDEQYQPDSYNNINSEPFKKADAEPAEGTATEEESQTEDNTKDTNPGGSPSGDYVDAKAADFVLNIGDNLSSGDVYKLNGPGDSAENYIGMNTSQSVDISVTLYDNNYELNIKDKSGESKTTTVDFPISSIDQPYFRIISTTRQLLDVMPAVHIYIYNNSSRSVNVSLEGTLLDNIHVYNGQKQEIQRGQTKGNISLT